jgi:hypothetical protein
MSEKSTKMVLETEGEQPRTTAEMAGQAALRDVEPDEYDNIVRGYD